MRGLGMPNAVPAPPRPFSLSLTLPCPGSQRLHQGGHGSMAGIGASRCARFLSASSTRCGATSSRWWQSLTTAAIQVTGDLGSTPSNKSLTGRMSAGDLRRYMA